MMLLPLNHAAVLAWPFVDEPTTSPLLLIPAAWLELYPGHNSQVMECVVWRCNAGPCRAGRASSLQVRRKSQWRRCSQSENSELNIGPSFQTDFAKSPGGSPDQLKEEPHRSAPARDIPRRNCFEISMSGNCS